MRAVARVRVMLVLLGTLVLLALACASALGSKGVVSVFGSSGSGDGQLANAYGTAVNLGTGEVYVVDQLDHRVERFDADGGFLGAFGWGVADGSSAAQTCSSGCQPGIQGSGDGQFDTPQGIAIDQTDGSVYVVDGNNNRVEKFDASGAYQSQFGSAGSADGQFSTPQGVAVDPVDETVYVADAGNNRVQKFDDTGSFVRAFGFGVADGTSSFQTCASSCQAGLAVSDDGGFSSPTRVAVDSTGRVYVLDFGNARIERYTAANSFDQVFGTADVFIPQEMAIGPGNDDLYVAQWAQDFSEQRVVEIDNAGTLVDTHAVGSTANNSSGLALGSGSQRIYLADGFNARVFILDDIVAPTVTLDPAANVTSTSASLSGSVIPNGDPTVGWRFEISTDDANWSAVAADEDAGNGNAPVPVTQNLTGLVPNTTYFVRLAATRPFNATTFSTETQFTTTAITPDVVTQPAQDIAPTHATFRATINANNAPTTYFFEYGSTTSYGSRVPVADADAGSATVIVAAIQRVDGLSSGTTYHFRIVANNQAGTVHGQDRTFTTTTPLAASASRPGIPGAGFLPDDRGWELVSPTDKGGNEVMADTGRTRAASDGGAASFASLGAFGGSQGTGVSVEYMSVRSGASGTSGWSTHTITPPQGSLAFQWSITDFDPRYEGELASDLSRGVFRTSSPITEDPIVANVGNLYVRDDLRTPGAGFFQLLTGCLVCGSTPLNPGLIGSIRDRLPRVAGASDDFNHVIFESLQKLTPDATATGLPGSQENLYEWDHGSLRLAGILPDDSSAIESQAGPGAVNQVYMPRTISSDGSRIFFGVNPQKNRQDGTLYERIDHSTTIQLNASERTDCADHDPCNGDPEPDPGGPQRARFWGASADGSRAFFVSEELLTDTATAGVQNLYLYDAAQPAGHRLRSLVPGGNGVRGVIGMSDDGHFVYFLADGQSVSGEPSLGGPGIFLWHDGDLSYIGELVDPARDTVFALASNWGTVVRFAARVTPDGHHLLFTSGTSQGLTGYDHGECGGGRGCEELYVYSADTHVLRCASCDPTGAAGTADALDNHRVRTSGSGTTWHRNHAVSADGRHVFFTTADPLLPADANGRSDVYEYDVPSGTVHLISSGQDPSDSYFMDASASGDDVFFLTRQQLAAWDHDQNYDLYDARVGGGLPEPAVSPPACSDDACQGALSGAPSFVTPGSSLPSGSGNVKATPKRKSAAKPVRCKRAAVRRKVKGKVRCVKPKKRQKRHAKKAADQAHRRAK